MIAPQPPHIVNLADWQQQQLSAASQMHAINTDFYKQNSLIVDLTVTPAYSQQALITQSLPLQTLSMAKLSGTNFPSLKHQIAQQSHATATLDEITDAAQWEAQFASSLDVLEMLYDEATAEHQAGHTLPLSP